MNVLIKRQLLKVAHTNMYIPLGLCRSRARSVFSVERGKNAYTKFCGAVTRVSYARCGFTDVVKCHVTRNIDEFVSFLHIRLH